MNIDLKFTKTITRDLELKDYTCVKELRDFLEQLGYDTSDCVCKIKHKGSGAYTYVKGNYIVVDGDAVEFESKDVYEARKEHNNSLYNALASLEPKDAEDEEDVEIDDEEGARILVSLVRRRTAEASCNGGRTVRLSRFTIAM